MLISAGIEPPRQVLVHGYLTVEGQKISKSLGNVIHPAASVRELAGRAGIDLHIAADAIRYYLLRDIPFGEDADFSRNALIGRFNADLANDYGNLLNRALPLVERHFEGRVPERGHEEGGDALLRETAVRAATVVAAAVDRLDFRGALEEIWKVLAVANRYLDGEAPWRVIAQRPERAGTILYNTLEALRSTTILLSPWLPAATERVWAQLGLEEIPLRAQRLADAQHWGSLPAGITVKPGAPVFPRIETRVPVAAGVHGDRPGPARAVAPRTKEGRAVPDSGRAQADGGAQSVDSVTIDEFRRLDIRVGEVLSATRIPGTDKLIEIEVDIGGDVRRMVTGLVPIYQPKDLVGKRIIVLANLQPRRVRGVESHGMLLAAEWDDEVGLLTVDKAAPKGSRIT